jgi:hypothetical protein
MSLRVAVASFRNRRRDVFADTVAMAGRLAPPPRVIGIEHIPSHGRCVILPNHYERPDGIWVGWGTIVLTSAIARRRIARAPIRWVMTSTWEDCYLGPYRVSPERLHWVLKRLAFVYDIILMPASEREVAQRSVALRALLRALTDNPDQLVAFHPEAGGFETLITPPRGMGRVLAAIDRRGIPMIPAGVFEADGRLTIQIGAPLPAGSLSGLDDASAADAVMRVIASLVPPATRGVYADRVAVEPAEEIPSPVAV